MIEECRYKQRVTRIGAYYMSPMGLRIKTMREAKGWTQEELAAKVNISRSQLAQIESEARPANTLRLNAIAAAFGVPTGALFSTSEHDDILMDAARRLSAEDRASLVRMAEALAAQYPDAH